MMPWIKKNQPGRPVAQLTPRSRRCLERLSIDRTPSTASCPTTVVEPPPRPRRKGIYILPNLFTLGALFGGFYAVVMAMNGRFEQVGATASSRRWCSTASTAASPA